MQTDRNQSSRVTAVPAGADGAVGVAAGKHAAARHWYVAMVGPRHEKAVAERLAAAGREVYVASQEEIHQWRNGRRRRVERVVIPSVVFVRCTERERREIVALPYIQRFLTNRSAAVEEGLSAPPAVIGEREMSRLRFMLGQSDYPVDFTPVAYHSSDTVRVVRGALRGLEGYVATDSAGTATVTVILPLLGATTVRLSPLDLEPA